MMRAIDLFAGLGGMTIGAVATKKVRVVWAGNHSLAACNAHEANHPGTEHKCQDLHQADFRVVPKHDLLLGASCCHGHSHARGLDRPEHEASRATAWAFVSCAEVHRQPAFLMENVAAFLRWTLYPAWELAMQRLGYSLSVNILDAADHGVPQHRPRVFIIGTRTRAPFELRPIRRPHVSFRAMMDSNATNWSPVATKVERTRRRVDNGRARFGREFLAPYYSRGSGTTGRSLDRPIGTITTKDRWSVIDGDMMRMLTVDETRRAMGFPSDYILPKNKNLAKHLLGNATPPPVVTDVLNDLCARL